MSCHVDLIDVVGAGDFAIAVKFPNSKLAWINGGSRKYAAAHYVSWG
jgi:hypothetical protein